MENEITNNLLFLAKNLGNLEEVMLHLEEKRIISTNERDEVLLKGTPLQKNLKFLDLIRRKDCNTNKMLILEILRNTNNEHCADKVEGIPRQPNSDPVDSMKSEVARVVRMLENISIANKSSNKEVNLKTHTITVEELPQQVWYGVTAPNTFYTGREKEMELLEKYWDDCSAKKTFSVVAVTGLGGVGKSELGKNYAKWFHENAGGHCIWIDAETDQSMEESFTNLAANLKISLNDDLGKEKKFLEIVQDIYKNLFGQKVLLVFDNLENYDQDQAVLKLLFRLASQQPPTVLKPFVITTSRFCEAKKHFGTQCNVIDLQVLTKESSVQFFCNSLNINEPQGENINELITRLCERLQFFPLAMQQATAFINERMFFCGNVHAAITNYLSQIETQTKALLNYKLPQYEVMDYISKTTFVTWRITFDKLKGSTDGGEIAIDIMNIISFLSPDNILSKAVIRILKAMGKILDVENINNFFELIRKYSLINYSGERISVHRLVQEVTRIELKERGEFHLYLNGVAKSMIGKKFSLHSLVHFQTVWLHLRQDKEMIADHGQFFKKICKKLYDSGKYRDLLDFTNESRKFVESALGQNNRWTLELKYWIGKTLLQLGEYSQSFEVLADVFEKQKVIFGEESSHYLKTANELGNVCMEFEYYEEALNIYKHALEKCERLFGNERVLTLIIKKNVAQVLTEQNNYNEALKLYEEFCEVEKRLLGVEHPNTLCTKHNIAAVKLSQKDYGEALKEFQEVLEIQERVLTLNHPNTLINKYYIAQTYYHLDRHQESFQLFKEVHEKEFQMFGPQHPNTIKIWKALRFLSDRKRN